MRDLWDRLERWIAEHVPEWLEQLNPGAGEEEIERAERELGVRFPEDFRESLKIHNGVQWPPGIIGGWELLSLNRILDEWIVWRDLSDDLNLERSEPEGPIKNDWYNLKWIPITYDGAGDHHCLDLDPAEGGNPGQVILMWHDDSSRTLEGRNFREWFGRYLDDLENGKYKLVREEDGFTYLVEEGMEE